jgi:hypothetical protein
MTQAPNPFKMRARPVAAILCALALGCAGCESVSDSTARSASENVPAVAPQAPVLRSAPVPRPAPPSASALPGSKPLIEVTAAELKALANELRLVTHGWSEDGREKQEAGYRNTMLSTRHATGALVSIWLRCDTDAGKFAEHLQTENASPDGKASAVEGTCALWVRAETTDRQKRTDLAQEVLEKIQRMRGKV